MLPNLESRIPNLVTTLPDTPADRRLLAILTLAALGGVILFIRLGFWQLDRAEEKRGMIAEYERGVADTLPLTASNVDTLPRYQQVRVRGHYDSNHQVLLDNMPSHAGFPGYRVLTPFVSDAGDWFLVDRGWVSLGESRTVLPSVTVPNDERAIVGRLAEIPRPGMRLGTPPPASEWPRVLNYPQREDLEKALGQHVPSRLILLDPDAPDGYERIWEPNFGVGASRHVAYAVQWFALAALVVTMYVVVTLRTRRARS